MTMFLVISATNGASLCRRGPLAEVKVEDLQHGGCEAWRQAFCKIGIDTEIRLIQLHVCDDTEKKPLKCFEIG